VRGKRGTIVEASTLPAAAASGAADGSWRGERKMKLGFLMSYIVRFMCVGEVYCFLCRCITNRTRGTQSL
jgi:hypothetical protein